VRLERLAESLGREMGLPISEPGIRQSRDVSAQPRGLGELPELELEFGSLVVSFAH